MDNLDKILYTHFSNRYNSIIETLGRLNEADRHNYTDILLNREIDIMWMGRQMDNLDNLINIYIKDTNQLFTFICISDILDLNNRVSFSRINSILSNIAVVHNMNVNHYWRAWVRNVHRDFL